MVESHWRIRPAIAADAPALTVVMQAAYTPYVERLHGRRLPPLDVDYAAEIAGYPVWVAERNGQIVGGLILMFEAEHATIANIAVHPDCQGLGLGRALLALAEAEARRRGYAEMRLGTHARLTENVAYYARLGWRELARDEVRVYMGKSVADEQS